MLIKKYEGPSLEAALARIKKELGPDALILSSEQKRSGWFQKPSFEVTVAFEGGEVKPKQKDDTIDRAALEKLFPKRRYEFKEEAEDRLELKENSKDEAKEKEILRFMELSKTKQLKQNSYEKFCQSFEKKGISTESAKELSRRLLFEYGANELEDSRFLQLKTNELVAENLRCISSGEFQKEKNWVFVGMPGAGKTSLTVKLALHLRSQGKNVRLSSVEKRKVLGHGELASYAKLMNVPFSAQWEDPDQSRTTYLLDGTALPIRDRAEQEEWARKSNSRAVCVVLDATGRINELMNALDQAEALKPTAIAFTRLDIATERGIVFEVLRRSKLPLLGVSLSHSFKKPFRFFSSTDLASYLLDERSF